MISKLKDRYKDWWTRYRAICHALGAGCYVGWFIHIVGALGYLALLIAIAIELFQWITKKEEDRDIVDSAWDLGEHLVGGSTIGTMFYLF